MASINSTKEETNFIDDEIQFLKHSRESWKAKYQESKLSMKLLKNRIRYLEKSKKEWKDLAKELKAELTRTQAELDARNKELEIIKKKRFRQFNL